MLDMGRNSGLKSSRVSVVSTMSNQEEKRHIEELTNTSNKKKLVRIIKMNLVVITPIIVLLAMAGILLQMSLTTSREVESAKRDIEFAIAVSTVVNYLQIERGTSAMFLSSNVSDVAASTAGVRNATNRALEDVPPDLTITLRGSSTSELVTRILGDLRSKVNGRELPIPKMIEQYTILDHTLLDLSVSEVDLPAKGMPWKAAVSINTLSRASDSVGIQRALGSTFFVTCGFDKATALWFIKLEQELLLFTQLSFFYYPFGFEVYQQKLSRTNNVEQNITEMKEIIAANDYVSECSLYSEEKRLADGAHWFATLTVRRFSSLYKLHSLT